MPEAFLSWVEASALGGAMRAAGPWPYAFVNLAHILGVSLLFGAVVVIDLRLLGAWRRVPLAALADTAARVAAAGFATAVLTGIALLTTNATEYAGNPFLAIKLPAILIGFLNAIAIRRSSPWRERAHREPTAAESRRLAMMGGVSLASWLTAVAAGRLIGYW